MKIYAMNLNHINIVNTLVFKHFEIVVTVLWHFSFYGSERVTFLHALRIKRAKKMRKMNTFPKKTRQERN